MLILAEEIPRTARNLGVALPVVEATTAEELDTAFASTATQHTDAIMVLADPLTNFLARRVVALAADIICPRFISSDNSPMAD